MPPLLARTSMKHKLNLTRSSPLCLGYWQTVSCHSINKEQNGENAQPIRSTETPHSFKDPDPASDFSGKKSARLLSQLWSWLQWVCVRSFLLSAFNLFLLYAHSTSTGSNINQISGSHTVTIYCLLPFWEEWEWGLLRGQQRGRENVSPTLLQVLSQLLLR